MSHSDRIHFPGHDGGALSARLERPSGKPRAVALFAHCFSCTKDSLAAARISKKLVEHGFSVLRFDFTGLGGSDGDFANTNFSSNVQDVVAAANWLKAEHGAIDLLIGHSLGGAAVIVAANQLADVKAVATIGAPSDAEHVLHQFAPHLETIEADGAAEVLLAERPFTIQRQFVDDVRSSNVREAAANLKRPFLVFHAPTDATVGIDNATGLFVAAKHPKSFVSLDDANHLLTRREDSEFVADTISAWAGRYLNKAAPGHVQTPPPTGVTRVMETGEGKYANFVQVRDHLIRSDEPIRVGGLDTGPTPTEYLDAALAACTSITLRMYLDRKKWPADHISVDVHHTRAEEADETGWNEVTFHRDIKVKGDLTTEQRARIVEIADKCPVHKILHHTSRIETHISEET